MKLFYRQVGESGSPIIILHGLFGSSDNWLTLGKILGETYRVYMLDARNHGQSPRSEIFDYNSMAADLKEFMDDHSIINPILIGHSMGGKTVMQFAMRFPGIIPPTQRTSRMQSAVALDSQRYLGSHLQR